MAPSSPTDPNGIVWPSERFLKKMEHENASRREQVTAYAQRLIKANPHLTTVSPENRSLVGVHLAARNARVLLHHRLGARASDVGITGRNHRHGSILDLEWFRWPNAVPVEKADLIRALDALTQPMDPRSASVAQEAFRQAFGRTDKLSINERFPSPEAVVQHEAWLLNQAFEDGPDVATLSPLSDDAGPETPPARRRL